MTTADTRQFMALMSIAEAPRPARHPHPPDADEKLCRQLRGDWPHLEGIFDPAAHDPDPSA